MNPQLTNYPLQKMKMPIPRFCSVKIKKGYPPHKKTYRFDRIIQSYPKTFTKLRLIQILDNFFYNLHYINELYSISGG